VGKELVAAAVIEMQVGVDHVPDVVGLEAEPRKLRHHVLAFLGLDGQSLHPLGPEPAHRIEARLAVHAGVEQQLAARMIDEEAEDGHGPPLARRQVRDHAGAVDLDGPGAQRVDANHHSHSRDGMPVLPLHCAVW
jgi:hypothetical protein